MKRLAKATWLTFAAVMISTALTVSVVRLLMPWMDNFRDELQVYLGNTFKTKVSLTSIKRRIYNYNPAIAVAGIRVYQQDQPGKTAVEIDTAILQLDTLASIRTLSPVFDSIAVDGAQLKLTFNNGQWGVAGFPQASTAAAANQPTAVSERNLKELTDVLNNQESIHFRDVYLQVANDKGDRAGLMVEHLRVGGTRANRHLSGRLVTDGGDDLSLNLAAEGPLLRWPDIRLSGHLKAEQINIKPWLPLFEGIAQKHFGIKLNQLRVAAEVQAEWNKGQWQVSSDLKAPMLDLDWQNRTLPPLTDFSTRLFAKGDQQDWQAWLQDWQFIFGGIPYPRSQFYFSSRHEPESQLTVATDSISLQPLKQMLDTVALPGITDKLLRVLNPRGELEQVVLRFYPEREKFDFDLAAILDEVAVDSWEGAPSGEHISGRLRMTAWEGLLDLESKDFVLGLDNVFDEDWTYEQVSGRLYWRITDDVYRLRTDRMHFVAKEGDLNARFRLDVPLDSEPVTMGLEVGITNGDARYAEKYLPVKIGMDEDLVRWLKTSIHGAVINDGAFIWNGPLDVTDAPNDVTWGLYFNIENGELMYSPDWPELKDIKGLVLVDQDAVNVSASRARLYDSRVVSLKASVPDLETADPLVLDVKAGLVSTGKDGLKLLRETPIAEAIHNAADNWSLGGDLDIQLSLGIPLKEGLDDKIDVAVTTDNGSFALTSPDVSLKNVAGQFHYTTEKGLYTQGLQALLYDKLVKLDIQTDVTSDTVRLGLEGTANVAAIQSSLGQDLSPWIRGQTTYRADLVIPDKGGITLDVTSELKGVTIPLPAPLGKAEKRARKLQVSATLPDKGAVTVRTTLGGELTSLLKLDGQTLKSGVVYFGKGKPRLPETGLQVAGGLKTLDLSPWQRWWQGYSQSSTQKKNTGSGPAADGLTVGGLALSVSDFSIQQLKVDDYVLDDTRFSVLSDPRGTHIRLTSPMAKGTLTVPNQDTPLVLDVEKLVLPESLLAQEEEPKPEQLEKDPLADVNPKTIPVMDIDIQDVRIGEREFGKVSLQTRKTDTGIVLQELNGALGGLGLHGSLAWNLVDGKPDTHYKGHISTGDLKRVLASWGYPDRITTRKAVFAADVAWPGSPAAFMSKSLKGRVGIDIKDGRFLSSDAASGVLRIFGILNLDSITRRLKLDFSDLFKSGVTFDRIKGVMNFNEGLITFAEPIEVSGPSSNFKLGGVIDLQKQNLNLELVVTLPVTENLPLVSLLLGQPQIAGAIYLFDKIWGKKVEQLASVRYEIKGPFADPDVKLDKLFSNKVKKD